LNWQGALMKENDGIHLNFLFFNRNGWWAEPAASNLNKNYETD
jgi:hypothetical protein